MKDGTLIALLLVLCVAVPVTIVYAVKVWTWMKAEAANEEWRNSRGCSVIPFRHKHAPVKRQSVAEIQPTYEGRE